MTELHIFDIDGTVLDSMKMWENVPSLYVRSLGKEPPEDLAATVDAMTVPETNKYIADMFEVPGGVEAVNRGIFEMLIEQYRDILLPYEDALAELEELAANGERMVAFSNTPHEFLDMAMERNDLLKYFEEVYTVEDVGLRKDNSESFRELCARLGVDPENALVHDDAEYALVAASEAGCVTKEYDRYR